MPQEVWDAYAEQREIGAFTVSVYEGGCRRALASHDRWCRRVGGVAAEGMVPFLNREDVYGVRLIKRAIDRESGEGRARIHGMKNRSLRGLMAIEQVYLRAIGGKLGDDWRGSWARKVAEGERIPARVCGSMRELL